MAGGEVCDPLFRGCDDRPSASAMGSGLLVCH